MESRKANPKPPKKNSEGEVALFWDYENVPIPKQNGTLFLQALRSFFQQHPPECARIYAHKEALPAAVLQKIRQVSPFRVKWVTGTGTNAADKVMIRSARDTLRVRPKLPFLVLISGDGHFRNLLRELGEVTGRTILICGQKNYNRRLFKESYHVFSSSYLAMYPNNWWEEPTWRLFRLSLKKDPLKFCPSCENRLEIRRNSTCLEYWCPTCRHHSLIPPNPQETPEKERNEADRKFIAL
ncbi:MAG: hypothetical protein RBG13Loki_1593 [Promethearchaeota archaeon CR_4]|nr:MAG: hypothetical protein RBG13Loki_1593 [Candidatus Lokiarchaeota archaeon CR_4]